MRDFPALALTNSTNREILGRLDDLGAPDCWLVSGCLFQTAWNLFDGHAPERGIKDYDLFYFDDGDLSWDAEDVVIRRAAALFADLGVEVEVRNQARVHLWYPETFGAPYPRLRSATDGIDHFLQCCSMIGLTKSGAAIDVYAPQGLDDIYDRVIRPNPRAIAGLGERYDEKARRWAGLWPGVTILPWDGGAASSAATRK